MIIKLLIYNILFPVAFVLYLPFFVRKLMRRGGWRRGFGERFGFFSRDQRNRLRELRRPVWLHAVSVGEVVAAIGFIEYWRQTRPELDFVLSTTTTTGHRMAQSKLPERTELIYSPIDFFLPVLRTLRLVNPRALIIFEVEIWPSLITLAAGRNIGIALVNGRFSDRSACGYARHRWFFRSLFKLFNCICVQSDADADRVRRVMGQPAPVYVCNTMKFDLTPASAVDSATPLLDQAFSDIAPDQRLVWVAGSTHAGEEDLLLRIFNNLRSQFPGLRLVLVPRHSERTARVEQCLRQHGLTYCRRSLLGQSPPAADCEVLLVDTTGELMGFYAAADLVYVGNSMAGNQGGHNIIEPALFEKAIVHGRGMNNFRLVTALFKQEKACMEAADEEELQTILTGLMENPGQRAKLGRAAREVVKKYRGAMAKTLSCLEQCWNG